MKVCSTCKEEKELIEFSVKRAAKDGHNSKCRQCDMLAKRVYRKEHKEAYDISRKKYVANNLDKKRESCRKSHIKHKEKYQEQTRKRRVEEPEHELLKGARQRAKKKGLPFNITLDDVRVPKLCPVLGIPLYVGEGVLHKGSPTLDRFVPELGYVQGNVNVISSLANTIKSNASWLEALTVSNWMKRITEDN